MATTIQVQETTKQLLNTLKTRERRGTYDEIIVHLVQQHMRIPDVFGYTKKKPIKFTKEDEMSFDEI